MKVTADVDERRDLCTLISEDCRIETEEDVNRWADVLRDAMKALKGRKMDILVDISGMDMVPGDIGVYEIYGKTVKDILSRHALSIVRYGTPSGQTETVVRLQSIKQHFASNLFPDREAALAELNRIRAARK